MALIRKSTKAEKVEAFAVARDIRRFDLLTEDLESEVTGGWTSSDFETGLSEFMRDPYDELEFIVVGVDKSDEEDMAPVARVISDAKELELKVLLVADDLSPMALHQLMRLGADDFAPYPLPKGALGDAIGRLRRGPVAAGGGDGMRNRRGLIMPVYGVAGGVGATTFAANLAWEMALATKNTNKRVALLDFNFQYGSVSTYLDLPRREAIYELISDASALDHDSLSQALTSFKSRLAVLTAPMDALPLDIISPEDVKKLLEVTAASYDFVIIDMPTALVHWSEHVLRMSETFFAILEVDMRSAQNTLRFMRNLRAEDLPIDKVQFALNRAPGFADMNGKARVKRLSESLSIDLNIMLPDGGKSVVNSCDQGLPLSETASKNALRKEIRKIATSLVEMADAEKAAVA
jgi:pilus assembly protein CpaE